MRHLVNNYSKSTIFFYFIQLFFEEYEPPKPETSDVKEEGTVFNKRFDFSLILLKALSIHFKY